MTLVDRRSRELEGGSESGEEELLGGPAQAWGWRGDG
jgi:hypothetical protein